MIPRVHADNKEELRRIRAMTAARKLEERMLNQARELQEGALRAQERAQARQDRDRQREAIRAEAEARFPVAPQNAHQAQERQVADQRIEAALEGLAQFDGALQRREVDLARQERDRIEWREREGRRMAQADQPPPQLPPNMDEIPLADRWRVWRDYENHGAPPNMVTDNELARMVALPVLRETAVEATECPICIEDLGEVGKTVLKCGHTVCVSCFLQQMMRATAETRARECACPVCRVSYIM